MLPAATSHQVACRLLLTGDLITAQVRRALGAHVFLLKSATNAVMK
jgi:hypothetical protein